MGPTIEEQRERIRAKNRPAQPVQIIKPKKQRPLWVNDLIDLSLNYADRLRKEATPQELLMQEFLENHNIQFIFQHPIYYFNHFYIIDFYLPFYRVAIEIDGNQHYTKEGKKHDRKRDDELRVKRIKTIRIPNAVFSDLNQIHAIFSNNGLFGNVPIITKPRKLNRSQRKKLRKKWQCRDINL